MEILKDLPYFVDIYKHHLKMNKYIPRLYRSKSRDEVFSILQYGKKRTDTYLKLGPRDFGYMYTDADKRWDDDEVLVAGWIMDFIEVEKPWDFLQYQPKPF